MDKRSSRLHSRHDRKVREIAERLKKQGWDVEADIPGCRRPGPIGKYKHTPDIRATNAGAEQVFEVETADTLASHKKQHGTFRRHAAQKSRSTFEVEEA